MASSHVSPSVAPIVFVWLFASFLAASCSFSHGLVISPCTQLENLPVTPLSAQTASPVPNFEIAGTIAAFHGSGTAKLEDGRSRPAIKVEQSLPIPAYANRATVFLNGWRVTYLGSNQHVLALASGIMKIRLQVDPATREKTLTWNAVGLLRDNDGKEGYSWSYNFTVLAWNDVNIDAAVDQGIVDPDGQYCAPDGRQVSDNYYYGFNYETTTALTSYFSFIRNAVLAGKRTVAMLPRGFGFVWSAEDHQLRQVGYNLDHSDVFVEEERRYHVRGNVIQAPLAGASVADAGFTSWGSYTILKDDDRRRLYLFAEIASAIGGNDVGVLQPPFSILPADDGTFLCGTPGQNGVVTKDVVIDNVPFERAVPMLTGWNLEFLCRDEHVKEVGTWIDDWSYEPPVGGAGGKLHYRVSAILRSDGGAEFTHAYRVTVLGFRPIAIVRGFPR